MIAFLNQGIWGIPWLYMFVQLDFVPKIATDLELSAASKKQPYYEISKILQMKPLTV